jgi:hypothetical protein
MGKSEESGQREQWALSGRPLWIRTALVFVLALGLFVFLYAPSPLIYDADSYYHLTIARGYAEDGFFDQLEWVRFGLLSEQFGDKEVLFHVALVPFASWMEPSFGGRLALALLGAGVLAIVGFLSLRAIGPWGVVIPLWLVVGSMEFTWRLVRLRPELASIIVLLLALWAAVQKRYLLLGLLSLVYALTYTAIHAYLGIFFLVFLGHAWALRRWDWKLCLYPLLGAGLGLLIHPQFPNNLVVWWYQSVEYFRFKGTLDLGTEIEPMRTDLVLLLNLGWLLGLAILWRASEKVSSKRGSEASLTFGIAASAFGVLYLMMSRFSLYCVALTTVWLLFEIHRQGRVVSKRVRLPWRGQIPLVAAWVLCLLVCLPVASYELGRYRSRNSPGPDAARIVDRQEFSAALPQEARVANPWRSTPIYMYWAPQGRYLNVLDPVFLAASDPPVFAAQDEIFSGQEPDVPMRAAAVLESEYLAYNAATGDRTLSYRLMGDPRIESVYLGINLLFRIRAPESDPFVVDWQLAPGDAPLPPGVDEDLAGWPRYPLAESPELRALEGFVDGRRVIGPGQCLGLVHTILAEEPVDLRMELAAAGPSTLWVDDRKLVETRGGSDAVVGRGTVFPLALDAGAHRLSVLTCAEAPSRTAGFYLVNRGGG